MKKNRGGWELYGKIVLYLRGYTLFNVWLEDFKTEKWKPETGN